MVNLKYTINEMIRKPIFLILIIIQVALGTSILLPSMSQAFRTYDLYSESKNTLIDKPMYQLVNSTDELKINKIESDKNYEKQVFTLYNKLKHLKSGSVISFNCTNIIIKNFTDNDKFYNSYGSKKTSKYVVNPYENVEGKFSDIKGLYVDEGFVKNIPLKTRVGNGFTENAFNTDGVIPVILGADYDGIYKVGDEFEYFDYLSLKLRKIKVSGILDNNRYICSGSEVYCLDDKVICPIQNIKSSEACKQKFQFWLQAAYITTTDKAKTSIEIRDISDKLKLYSFNLSSIDKEKQYVFSFYKKNMKSAFLISITIFVFIAAGIITVQLNSIEEKKMEYGTHLLCGCSRKDILLRNLYAVSLYIGVGMLLGAYIEYVRIRNEYWTSCNSRSFIMLFLIYLVLVCIVSYLPYRKLRSFEINDILKGLSE